MSSAAQTSQSVKTLPATGDYAVRLMRALAPHIDQLAAVVGETRSSTGVFSVNAQLMNIQTALAEARHAIETSIPRTMLQEGGAHPYFVAIGQRSQGDWIRDTYWLVSSLSELVRSKLYAVDTNPSELRSKVLHRDSVDDISIPRLLRAAAKSYLYTNLYLGVPNQRALYGIKTDFATGSLRRFLANSSVAV